MLDQAASTRFLWKVWAVAGGTSHLSMGQRCEGPAGCNQLQCCHQRLSEGKPTRERPDVVSRDAAATDRSYSDQFQCCHEFLWNSMAAGTDFVWWHEVSWNGVGCHQLQCCHQFLWHCGGVAMGLGSLPRNASSWDPTESYSVQCRDELVRKIWPVATSSVFLGGVLLVFYFHVGDFVAVLFWLVVSNLSKIWLLIWDDDLRWPLFSE